MRHSFDSIERHRAHSGIFLVLVFTKASEMALRIQISYPNTLQQSTKSQASLSRAKTLVFCKNKKSLSDVELASDLAKIKSHMQQKEEAMEKSRELLFGSLCEFLEMKEEQAKRRWSRIDEDEKLGLVRRFVGEWGVDFHPLSAKSVKELIEEYLCKEELEQQSSSSSSSLFSSLKRLLS